MPASTCVSKKGRTMLGWVGRAELLLLLGADVAGSCWFTAQEFTEMEGLGHSCTGIYILDLCKEVYIRLSQIK